jgi:hypothetical protein
MEYEKVDRIIDGYENYFNMICGQKIISIKGISEIEWVDMNRGTILIRFCLRNIKDGIKIEIESIRHMLIDSLIDEGFIGLLGNEISFLIKDEENIHKFFKLLEDIKYFNS